MIAAVAVGAHAQSSHSTASVDVNLVEVPVTVTTGDGQPVRGLTKRNFEVYDQGHKKEITNFEVVDVASVEPAVQQAGGAARPAAGARNFMLLFDLGNSLPSSLVRARTAALNFIQHQLLPGDRIAVATIAPLQGFRLQANFSTDRQLAEIAIQTLGSAQSGHSGDPLLLTRADIADLAPVNGRNGASELPTSRTGHNVKTPDVDMGALAEESIVATSHMTRTASDQAQRQYVQRQLHDFTAMGDALDRVQGRKQVILLSEGFDPKALQGHATGTVNSEEAQAEQSAAESGEIWRIDNDARFGSSSSRSDLGAMVDALRRADVVLNAIDIRGLRGNLDATADATVAGANNDSLFLLTNDTGGVVYRNSNDLQSNFAQLLKSQEVTYVLAFNGATSEPGAFHNLKVKLVNAPKARVNYRVGYYEPRPVLSDMDRLLSASEILMNSVPMHDVDVRALATVIPGSGPRAEVPVVIETDGKDLLSNAGTSVFEEIYVYAFNQDQLISDYAHQRMSLDLAKVRDRIAAAGVKLYATLDLAPGDYDIRVLVVADGTRNGFTSTPLHVPQPNEPYALAAINDPRPWLMVKAADKQQDRPYPFALGEKMIVPAARPSLSRGAHEIALLAHGFGVEPLQVDAVVEDASGNHIPVTLSLVGRTDPDAQGNVKLLYSFAPQVANGQYSLVATLRSSAHPAPLRVTMPFTME
ncbi:MAG: VWA domain-containing protein [Acidobacteria bacterium]|nr:VWA domain-containing protein [Acidobacteriota bacterium]MBV9479072.1 VWA domain-containing protein [Acidobacteriota bacterium]